MANEKEKSNKNLVLTAIIVTVVGVAAFYGGMIYQKTQVRNTFGQFAREGRTGQTQTGMMRNGTNRGFGGAVVGEIVNIDNDSLTIKLQDGSSKIVNLSTSTTYSKTEAGAKTDLKVSTRVAAIGATNSDGSITAQNIQINPMFRMGARPSAEPTK